MDDKPLFNARTSSYMSWVSARTQSTLKRSPSTVKTFWLSSQRQARADFKARSGRGCLWVLAFLWFGGLTTGVVLLFAWASYASSARRDGYLSTCLPDDSFSLRPETYQYWSNSGFFEITLGSGRLTFTQAKAIDVIWDIVSVLQHSTLDNESQRLTMSRLLVVVAKDSLRTSHGKLLHDM